MKNKFYTLAALLVMGITANAQVGIGTTAPATSSMLDVASTTKGFLMPRMTTANRIAIASPAAGLQVYDTTTNSIWFFNGSTWLNGGLNIYNSNGSLTGDRTVGYGGKNLTFSGGSGSTFFTSNNALPVQITGPLSTTANSMLRIGGASGTAAVGQQALIGFNPNFVDGAYPVAIGSEYVNGAANQGAADFVVKTSNGGGATTRFVVQNSGNVGIGTTNPGAKLEVNGAVKITDGSQAAGKVLTSDANGLASWQTVATGSTADGSETKVQAGTNTTVTGSGTVASPYIVNATAAAADGSETKVSAGTNTTVTGSGTTAAPYVVNAVNLYTNNGTLTGGRTVTMGANNLQFNATTGTFIVNAAAGAQAFTQTGAGIFGIDAPNVSNGRLVVLENGNVGIGKQTPTAKLDITGQAIQVTNSAGSSFVKLTNDTNDIRLQQNNGTGFVGSLTNNDFQVYSNNLPRITAAAGGNVGIGITSPVAKLDVAGNVKIADGTQGAGKVLTSDANGLASWATAASTADGSETKVTAGTNVTITGSGTAAAPYVVNAAGASTGAIVFVTAPYTITAADSGKILIVNSATAVTLTTATTLPAGFYCEIIQKGAGRATIAGGSGVTINNASGTGKLTRVVNSAIGLIMESATVGYVTGDSAP